MSEVRSILVYVLIELILKPCEINYIGGADDSITEADDIILAMTHAIIRAKFIKIIPSSELEL